MDITGNITAILPAQSGTSQRTGNTWMRQEYVIEIPGSYPRHMCFSIFGEDRIKQFDLHQGEQGVTVQFDIDAHEYNGRWFNEIRAYNIIRPYQGAAAQTPQTSNISHQPSSPFPPPEAPAQGGGDDLPF